MSGSSGNAGILIRDRRNGQWAWVNNAVLADPHLTAAEKVVYSALATFDGCEVIRPSIPTIAERSSLGVRTVRMALKKLQQVGYISVEAQKNGAGPSVYTLLKAASGCNECREPRQILHPGKICTPAKSAGDPGKKVLQTPAKSAAELDNEYNKRQTTPSAVPQNGHFKLEPPPSDGNGNGRVKDAELVALVERLVPFYLKAVDRPYYKLDGDLRTSNKKTTRQTFLVSRAREICQFIHDQDSGLDHAALLENTESAMRHVIQDFAGDDFRKGKGNRFTGLAEYVFRDWERIESALGRTV